MNKTTALFLFAVLLLASVVYLIKNEQDSTAQTNQPRLRKQTAKKRFQDPEALILRNDQTRAHEEKIEALRAEIASLKEQMSKAKANNDAQKQAAYVEMLRQLEEKTMANPIDLPWEDFYKIAKGMKVDDNTLKKNILEKLKKELNLTNDQVDKISVNIDRERIALIKSFQNQYGMQRIEGFKYGSTDEETKQAMDTLKNLRSKIRNKNQNNWEGLGLTEKQMSEVQKHLRNEHVISFTTDGYVGGGMGIPENEFKKAANKDQPGASSDK